MTIKNKFLYTLLYLMPKNLLSMLMGCLVSYRLPKALSIKINRMFADHFAIDLSEAEKPIEAYPSLQEFFIRKLKVGIRPIAPDCPLVSPCDGVLSVAALVEQGSLVQAKGKTYSLSDLLIDKSLVDKFAHGFYSTIYLSPRDYHRFHAPITGVIERTIYVPGQLWPVNRWAVDNVDRLFCRNERVITLIRNEENLLLAHIAVGATMVGKIDLSYVQLDYKRTDDFIEVYHEPVAIKQGMELGKFMFGSTIIILMEKGLVREITPKNSAKVKMGEILGRL